MWEAECEAMESDIDSKSEFQMTLFVNVLLICLCSHEVQFKTLGWTMCFSHVFFPTAFHVMCFPCFEDAAALALEEEVLGGSIEVPQEIMRTRQQKEPWWSKTMGYHGRFMGRGGGFKYMIHLPLMLGGMIQFEIQFVFNWLKPPTIRYWRGSRVKQPERTWLWAASLDLWGMFGFYAREIVGRQRAAAQNVRFFRAILYPNL